TACQITGNDAQFNGAGIFNMSWDPYPLAQLTLIGSTVSHNTASVNSGFGGGLLVGFSSQATVIQSTISGNLAEFGAGIDVEGAQLTVVNSTISENGANAIPGAGATFGGGIDNIFGGATVSLDHVTLSHNIANAGAGICNFNLPGDGGSLTIGNSIIADNLG